MPATENKAKIRRTITDLGFAKITAISDEGVPTYGNVEWFAHHEAGGREYSAEPAGSSGSVWADGREVYAWEDSQGYDVTLTTVGVTDDIEEDWYGYTVSQSGKVEEYADGAEYPQFALILPCFNAIQSAKNKTIKLARKITMNGKLCKSRLFIINYSLFLEID